MGPRSKLTVQVENEDRTDLKFERVSGIQVRTGNNATELQFY